MRKFLPIICSSLFLVGSLVYMWSIMGDVFLMVGCPSNYRVEAITNVEAVIQPTPCHPIIVTFDSNISRPCLDFALERLKELDEWRVNTIHDRCTSMAYRHSIKLWRDRVNEAYEALRQAPLSKVPNKWPFAGASMKDAE